MPNARQCGFMIVDAHGTRRRCSKTYNRDVFVRAASKYLCPRCKVACCCEVCEACRTCAKRKLTTPDEVDGLGNDPVDGGVHACGCKHCDGYAAHVDVCKANEPEKTVQLLLASGVLAPGHERVLTSTDAQELATVVLKSRSKGLQLFFFGCIQSDDACGCDNNGMYKDKLPGTIMFYWIVEVESTVDLLVFLCVVFKAEV